MGFRLRKDQVAGILRGSHPNHDPRAMIIGYYRLPVRRAGGIVSSEEPAAVLRAQRCMRIEVDQGASRGALNHLLTGLTHEDVLVSPAIEYLATSLRDLLRIADKVHKRMATLRLVGDQIDTSVPGTRLIFGSLADYERRTFDQKLHVGLVEAADRGARPGRPRKIGADMFDHVRTQIGLGRSYASLARELNVHPTTVMRMAGQIDRD